MMTKHKIRQQAERLHQKFDLAFPVNIKLLCEKLGIRLEQTPLEDDVSGMIVMGDQATVVIINQNHHPTRRRFTGAHEIGHFSLHYKPGAEFVDTVRYRRSMNEPAVKPEPEEAEANYFAAELLMPRCEVELQITKANINLFHDEAIAKLAKHFGVSKHAMTIRLSSLGYIPDWAML